MALRRSTFKASSAKDFEDFDRIHAFFFSFLSCSLALYRSIVPFYTNFYAVH